MRLIALVVSLWISQAFALECPSPAKLMQADGKDDTLHSWCETDGARDGVYEVVSLKKGLELRAHYEKGQLDGRFQRFSGNTVTVDGKYSEGKMSGEWTRRWDNGEKRDQGKWKDDKPVGKWRSFNDAGNLEREVTYDTDGKIKAEEKPKEKPKLTSADWLRFRLGVAQTSRDHAGDHGGPALGFDIKLFRLGRWFRADFAARLVPDMVFQYTGPNSQYKKDKVYSGQFGLSFDFFPNLTDPVVLYGRIGVMMVDFDKDRGMFGFGLRWHFTNKRQNWWPNGMFVEVSGSEGNNDNQGQCSPGPCSNNNNQEGGGSFTFFTGAMWSFF